MLSLRKPVSLHKPDTTPSAGLRHLIQSNHPAELYAAFSVPPSTLMAIERMVRG